MGNRSQIELIFPGRKTMYIWGHRMGSFHVDIVKAVLDHLDFSYSDISSIIARNIFIETEKFMNYFNLSLWGLFSDKETDYIQVPTLTVDLCKMTVSLDGEDFPEFTYEEFVRDGYLEFLKELRDPDYVRLEWPDHKEELIKLM